MLWFCYNLFSVTMERVCMTRQALMAMHLFVYCITTKFIIVVLVIWPKNTTMPRECLYINRSKDFSRIPSALSKQIGKKC